MLDFQVADSSPRVMSRKRTRSRSEDNINTKIQPLNVSFFDPAPFSDDPTAIKVKEECDYSQKITYEMAVNGEAPRPIRVYADGAYDLFHQGHAKQLKQAKTIVPNVYLIVGVCNDALLHRMKGRTVLDEEERYTSVRHCRYVDEVVKDAPWEITDDFLEKHKIDFVAHDDIPYATEDKDDIYAHLKAKGMFLATQRTEGVSTSDIVARIVRDYDVYVRRNLARGYSAKELNISYIKEKKFRFQNRMEKIRDKSRQVIDSIGEKTDDLMNKWEEKSKEFVENFMMLFEPVKLKTIWSESKEKLRKAFTPPSSPTPSSSSSSNDDDGAEDLLGPPRKIRKIS